MKKQHTTPLIISGKPENRNILSLEKVSLTLSSDGPKLYDEDWIQDLIHNNPLVLPVEELEPAFFPLYPVCRELKTPAGYLDNLFVSANGSLTLVECKLWRNPEARREVVGQALDYAKEFASWQYEDLAQAIKETTNSGGNMLYDSVASDIDGLDEATFVDSVSKNLRRGRFLILIVGDGIREGVENISNFLQKHAGLDFTFGLVELGLFKIPEQEQYIVHPRILARTYTVERAVIRAEGAEVKIEAPRNNESVSHKSTGRSTSISEEQFFENIAEIDKDSSEKLKEFVTSQSLSDLNIIPGYGGSSLNLRWSPDGNLNINFSCIKKSGAVDTSLANWNLNKLGIVHLAHEYQRKLASIMPGSYVREHENPEHWEVHKNNKRIQISDLLPVEENWVNIIKETQENIMSSLHHG